MLEEVVAAVIGVDHISTNLVEIETSLAEGAAVRYITRRRAVWWAWRDSDDRQWELSHGPTLFFIQNGVRFLPRNSPN